MNALGPGRIENVALRRPGSDQAHPCICDFAAAMSTGTSISNKTYQQFLLAESKRQFFLTNIRNCLRYERLANLQVA